MAHVLTVGDLVEFTAICKTQNQYTFNVMHFPILTVVGATVTEQDVGVDLDNIMAPLYKALLPTNGSYYGSKVQVVLPFRFDPVFRDTNRGAGTIAGDSLPTQTCGLINLKTGIAKRSGRGRVYLPATSEGDNDATAVPSALYLAAAANLVTAIQGYTGTTVGGGTVTSTWAVHSKKDGISRPVTVATVRPNWATQRRRSQIKHADTAPF